jgi:hypothetical protein
MTTVRCLLATGLLALALSPTASAKTVTYKNIEGPNRQVSCFAVMGSTEIECSATFVPEIGELDTYHAIRARGKSILAERGDYPGIRCTMRRTGLTCRNLDDHGFHLERGHVRRF